MYSLPAHLRLHTASQHQICKLSSYGEVDNVLIMFM
jgi:hypothetical protein